MKHPLQELRDREINFTILAFWDQGFIFKLGDEMNGFKAENEVRDFDEGVNWLVDQANKFYGRQS